MKENQNIEWKQSWRDEYLRWICGFANAEGGTLVIGRNDRGEAVGIPDAAKLLEDLPNKVRDVLGIMVDVNLLHEDGKELLEIRVEPYPSPVSYKGEYSSGIPIQISVYEHKIVLWNAGQLPERWTLEKLMGKHPSNPFNPLLASAFFRAGYVESWGRGIEKMRRECADHDVPAPIFDTSMSGLMLTFKANPAHLKAALGEKLASALLGLTGEVEGALVPMPEWGERWGERWGEKAAATRLRIVRAMRSNPHITTVMLATELGVASTSGVEKHLKALREVGWIRRIGPAKGGHWEVLK